MVKAVAGIFAIIIIASMGVVAYQSALENAGEDITVTNETWTPDAGNFTQLEYSDSTGAYYNNDTSVYDENGTLVDPGTDYEWRVENGSVKALSGGELDGDADATISYSLQQTTAEQRRLVGMIGLVPQAVGLLIPVFVVVLFFKLV